MQWYKVKLKNLPKINFKTDTIEHYVTQPASSHQRQIYVLANSWGYMMVKNSDNPGAMEVDYKNQEKLKQFFDIIRDIKKNNQGKEVILVVGDIERTILTQIPNIKRLLPLLGLNPMSVQDMHNAGIQGKLWRLTP